MVKFSIFLRRRSGMKQEEFVSYHKNHHAPLFTSLPEVKQYVRKYVQCHAVPVSLPGMPDAHYDGIIKLWFDEVEAIGKVFGAEDYLKIIRADEEKFLDLATCSFLVSAENPVI